MKPPTPTANIVGSMPIAHHIGQNGASLQAPFDAAVVIPSLLRPSLIQALRSIYAQSDVGRIHILIGVDQAAGDLNTIESVFQEQPENFVTTLLNPGYSTSTRHGGLHEAGDGGALRTILSYMANSRYVAYLDDVARLLKAIRGHDYAYTLRWYVEPVSLRPLCIDTLESVGPNAGGYKESYGGFVDPNCLMLDKIACQDILGLWSVPLIMDDTRMTADRNVFRALAKNYKGAPTQSATVFYTLNDQDKAHATRMEWIAQQQKITP
ncbi:MAG: glycosyltransferase family 2 protein [Alphaproteobacteria bacterium]|nr:glycosyltransferase family 2 protein [Alphaproteobacteria bacterium]